MSVPINPINSSFYLRIEPIAINRTELIAANNRQITALENQIIAQKEVSSITREMIANNTDQINITKEIIANNTDNINTIKELIGNNEKTIALKKEQIANNNDTISTIKELISNNEKRITNNTKAIDCIEKMLAIMMKNPAKYGGLDKSQFQQLPKVLEAKKNLTEVVAVKLNEYPKEEHAGLMDTAKKVIDRSFDEINTYDLSFNKKIFSNLEKNIDTAIVEQYTLMKDDYISTIKNYRIIQSLFYNFSNISIKNFKI